MQTMGVGLKKNHYFCGLIYWHLPQCICRKHDAYDS